MILRNAIVLCLLLSLADRALSQVGQKKEHDAKVRGAIIMGNSRIPQATEGGKSIAIIPVWGLDLDYYFHRRWSLGIQADIKVQSFEVEEEGQVLLNRNFPISIA